MNLRFLVITAVFIAIAIVLRPFAITVAAGGILTMRISFDAICYTAPGLILVRYMGNCRGIDRCIWIYDETYGWIYSFVHHN